MNTPSTCLDRPFLCLRFAYAYFSIYRYLKGTVSSRNDRSYMRGRSQHNTPPRFYVLFSFHVLFLSCLKLVGTILYFFSWRFSFYLFIHAVTFMQWYTVYERNSYASSLPKQTLVLKSVLQFIYRNTEPLAKVRGVGAQLPTASCRYLVFMPILVARYNILITISLVLQVIIWPLCPCRPVILATWPTFCDCVHFFYRVSHFKAGFLSRSCQCSLVICHERRKAWPG